MDKDELKKGCDKAFKDEILSNSEGYKYDRWIFEAGFDAAYEMMKSPTAGEIRYSLRAAELSDKLDKVRETMSKFVNLKTPPFWTEILLFQADMKQALALIEDTDG